MKRFLIYLFLFPAIATAAFYGVVYLLTGAQPDSLTGAAFIYFIFIAPSLLTSFADWFFAKRLGGIRGLIATSLLGYVVAVVFMVGEGIKLKEGLSMGLIGGIPALVCSWLANGNGRVG
jgi:hypothetical protein